MKIKSISNVGKNNVYDITVKDAHNYVLENGVVTHNSGVMYSANTVFIITKSQEKDGSDIIGWNYNINIEKSRYVKEKSKLTFQVLYDSGISKFSGLLDIALESGHVIKPSNGWYTRVINGLEEDKKVRLKEMNNEEFWKPILEDKSFNDFIKRKYQLGESQINRFNSLSEENEEKEELNAD